MSKRLMLLNLFLVLACIYVGRTVYFDYREFEKSHNAEDVQAEASESHEDLSLGSRPATRPALVPEDFILISDKNLFIQSRTMESPESEPVVEAAPNLRPKPVLMGVAMVGNETMAFIKNNPPQRGQRATQTLRMGEVYRGYRVSLIHKTRVELTYTSPSGNMTTEVLDIHDPENRSANNVLRTPVAQSQVISVGGAAPVQVQPGMPAGAEVQAEGQAIDAQGRRIIQTPFGNVIQGAPEQPGTPLDEARRQGQAVLQQEMQNQDRPLRRNEVIDDQGRRIIRTPFGDIVRRPDPKKPPSNH